MSESTPTPIPQPEPELLALQAALAGDRPALAAALGGLVDWQIDALLDGLSALAMATTRRLRDLDLSKDRRRIFELDMSRLALALARPALAQHSPACLANQLQRAMARLDYINRWPNSCSTCGGWGGFHSSYKPAPGPGSLPDFDTCTACIDNGRCPRCAELLDEDLNCPACGWQSDKPDGLPPAADCICPDPDMGEIHK